MKGWRGAEAETVVEMEVGKRMDYVEMEKVDSVRVAETEVYGKGCIMWRWKRWSL